MRTVRKIVVHCSDTPDSRDVKASEIHEWHIERGWSGVGYHAVIERSGNIEWCRPDFWIGSHVKGHNGDSLGICLVGRFNFAPEQYQSLRNVIHLWRLKYPLAAVMGHHELDGAKSCPNFNVQDWWSKNK